MSFNVRLRMLTLSKESASGPLLDAVNCHGLKTSVVARAKDGCMSAASRVGSIMKTSCCGARRFFIMNLLMRPQIS